MSSKNDKELDRLRKDVQNALNRTLTKVKKEQSNFIINHLALTKKRINFFTTPKRARPDDMSISLFTVRKYITPAMLPRKVSNAGITVTVSKQKSVFLSGFAQQTSRRGAGKFLISSKNLNAGAFSVSRHFLRSSYTTSGERRLSQPREAFIAKRLKDDLSEFALKDAGALLEKAQEIFNQELEK